MAFKIQILEGWVKVTFDDQLTVDDLRGLLQAADEMEAKAEVVPNRVTDLSGVRSFRLGFKVAELHAARRRAMPLKNKFKSAIVAPQPVQYGFARMFQTLVDHPQINVRLFRDMESAERWVKEPGLA